MQVSAGSICSRELVEQLFIQPYCRIANLVDSGIAKRQTASTYHKQLCDIGVLKEHKLRRAGLDASILAGGLAPAVVCATGSHGPSLPWDKH